MRLFFLVYQSVLKPVLSSLGLPDNQCRFQPTCSEYCLLAFKQHPPHKALWLSLRRVLRCHPLSARSHDPLP